MKKQGLANSTTVCYSTQANGIRAVVVATTVDSTLAAGEVFKDIAYGNTTLYGITDGSVFSINVTTGALTRIARINGATSISVYSATQLLLIVGNSLILMTISTGAYTYLKQDIY